MEHLKKQILDENIKEEFRAAVEWRFNQAESYRTMEYGLHFGQITISFIIAALGAFQTSQGDYLGIAIIIISLLSAVLVGIKAKTKCYENWKRYRNALEDIKSLTRTYVYANEPFEKYNAEDNKKLYMSMLNNIIATETKDWKKMRDTDVTEQNQNNNEHK